MKMVVIAGGVAICAAIGYSRAESNRSSRWAAPRATSHVLGDLRMLQFASRVFNNTRTLRVLLPDGYDDPQNRTRRYPVLYLNDGQALFDSATAPYGVEWRVDETVHDLVAAKRIPPLIVVGIDNAGQNRRATEYLPYPGGIRGDTSSHEQGKRFPEFLVDEVMPFINARYRTAHTAELTGVGGSSFGATAALYAVMTRPTVFGWVLAESPRLHMDGKHIFRDAARVHHWPARVYIGVGTNEGDLPVCPPAGTRNALVDETQAFADLIRHESVATPTAVRVVVDSCARHDEVAWGRRFPTALTFLLGAPL